MRIMLINTYYYTEIVGGAEYSVKKLAEALSKAGHQVTVLCTGDESVHEMIDGVKVVRIKANVPCRAIRRGEASACQKMASRMKEIWNKGNERLIEAVLIHEKPDVIHTNGLYDISPIVWKVAKRHGIRVVHTLRDYYLCCPLVSMECENNKCKFKNTLCPIHRKANIRAVKRYVDILTAPSSVTLNKVVNTMRLHTIETKVIPNAIDYDPSEMKLILEKKQSRNPSNVKFVYLGTLSEKKGVLWLLDSFEKIVDSNVELYIAGKGDLENKVKDSCSKDHRIHFVGFLEERQMNKLLEDMDVLICPSLWEEPFGRVVLDAYKHALPVIASDRGALPELLNDGETGRVVHSMNKEELVTALRLYIDDHDVLVQQRANCIRKINQYSITNQVVSFLKVYSGNQI